MGLFGQKQRKGHQKTSSQHNSGLSPLDVQVVGRPVTASSEARHDQSVQPLNTARPHEDYVSARIARQWQGAENGQLIPPDYMQNQMQAVEESCAALDEALARYSKRRDIRDVVGDQFSECITLIDEDSYHGPDREFIIKFPSPSTSEEDLALPKQKKERSVIRFDAPRSRQISKSDLNHQSAQTARSLNFFSKVAYYSNSRLPSSLPPLKVYISTWPLFCLAAQYSNSAYRDCDTAARLDTSTYVPPDSSLGTKAMVINSHPCDSQKTIVFAIRGTSVLSLRDWNTNFSTTPSSPAGFLDDEGNLCHSGFLRVARAMTQPIAMRLRQLLEQNPSRSACSLLITGHSAGGAVAALLFAHILSTTVESDLTILASCFKRVHCVTFGAPPISLLPLDKPRASTASSRTEHNVSKCLFHSFINEGDPVVRAEKSYVRSLIDLVTTQIPPSKENIKTVGEGLVDSLPNISRMDLNIGAHIQQGKKKLKKMASRPGLKDPVSTAASAPSPMPVAPLPPPRPAKMSTPAPSKQRPTWTLPPSTLSNAGRLVVLRVPPLTLALPSNRSSANHDGSLPFDTKLLLQQQQQQQQSVTTKSAPRQDSMAYKRHEFETVRAEIATDEQLRQAVFGDVLMHAMEVYRRRIEALAMKAVTVTGH